MNRVFRFLASYVPKTDKAINIVLEIFKTRPHDPEPPMPNDINQLIPPIVYEPQLKTWQNADAIIQHYKLLYDVRSKLINRLVSFFGSSCPSISQSEYMAMITLQSCCTLLFTPVESINPNDLDSFMSCLKISTNYLPKILTVFPDFFALIYERLLSIDDSCDITLILPPIQKFAFYYPEYTSSCLNTHTMVFSRLAHLVLMNRPSLDTKMVSNQIFIISNALSANQYLDKEVCKRMLPEVFLLMGHLKNQRTISIIVIPVISLFIILKKQTDCDTFQLIELLKFLITGAQNFEYNSQSKIKFDSVFDENLPINMIFLNEKTFEKSVPSDLENIKRFDNLMKLTRDQDCPLIRVSTILGEQLNRCPFDVTKQILTSLFSHFRFSYSYFAFLFLMVQQFTEYRHAICQVFTSLNLWKIIFGPKMFDPNVMNDINTNLLRQSLFDSLASLAKDDNDAILIIRKFYCHFLENILNYPEIFAQVMQMSYPSFRPIYFFQTNDKLYDIIMQELLIQQKLHIEGDKDAPRYRIPTMTVLSALFQNDNAVYSVVTSQYFCKGTIHFLFEEPIQDFFSNIIDRMIQYFSLYHKTNKIDSTAMNDSFHQTFVYLIENIKYERSTKLIHLLLNLFTRVASFEPSFITPLLVISSSILSDVMSILVNLPPIENSNRIMKIGLMLLFTLHNCPNFNYEAVPFASIGESIQRIGITDDFLVIIYQIIFGSSENMSIIIVPEALQLLLIAVKGTDKYIVVLKKLIEICQKSVCNCCSCLTGNVPTIIFENTSNENISIALELFTYISKYITNRRSLFSFFRLFSSFSSTVLNPLTLSCIDVLEQIIQLSNNPEYCSLMQFSSSKSTIVLPPLSVRDLQNGFIISARILLDSENCLRFFHEFKNDTQQFCSYFDDGTLYFSLNGSQITPTFDLPIQKWFTLSLYFKNFQTCDVYVDTKLTESIVFPEIVFQDFKKCSMFHRYSIDQDVEPLQVQHATIFAKPNSGWNLNLNINIPYALSYSMNQSSEMKTFMNYSTKLFDFHADKIIHFESGKNFLTRIPSAQYSGQIIRFFTNFLKVFEASHSVSFIITLFAQIDFLDPITKSNSHHLLQKLLSLLTLLITKSPENANNMLACNSYSIISFFLIESSALHLSSEVWQSFFYQMAVTNSSEQKEMICQWILFNYKIWKRASIDTKIKIFSDWKTITTNWPSLSSPYVHIPFLLNIFRGFVPSKDNIPLILERENSATLKENHIEDLISKLTHARHLICSLLTTAIDNGMKDTDSDLLFYSIAGCSEDIPTTELLDFVKQILVQYDLSLKIASTDMMNISIPWNYLTTVISIKGTWASIYINLSQRVCCKFESIYVGTNYINHEDTNKFCQYLIARRTCDSNCTEDSSECCLVTNSCRLMLHIDESTSLQNMIEMESLFLQTPQLFTYAVVSCISSSEKMNDLFVQFFDKLCKNDSNLAMLGDKMTSYSLFYLMYWAVKRRPIALLSISKIISRKSILTQNAINIIDSFSIFSRFDLSQVRSTLLSNLMDIIPTIPLDAKCVQLVEVLALAILFRAKVSSNKKMIPSFMESPFKDQYLEFENNLKKEEIDVEIPELEYLSSFYVNDPNPDSPVLQTFSLFYDENGKWAEISLAKRIIAFLSPTIWTNFGIDIHQSLCILINEVILESDNLDDFENYLIPIIKGLISEFGANNEFINLILRSIYRRKDDSIYDKLGSIVSENIISAVKPETFLIGFFALNNYCDQPPASLPGVIRDLVISFVSILEQFPKTPKPLSAEIYHLLNEKISRTTALFNDKAQIASRHWRHLWQQMSYDRSPFYIIRPESSLRLHYKRSPYVDKFLRPILKRNMCFNQHLDASMKRDSCKPGSIRLPRTNSISITSLPSHFNFLHEASVDNLTELQQAVVPNRYIWKARCELVKITKTTEGSFVISSGGFSFLNIEDELRIFISADSVDLIFHQYMLQRPTAVEIFTTTHKAYFFNFPDVDSHKFVSYFRSIPMPNARFVQSYSPQAEMTRLDLTRKWATREISTFEYLMWINELSGRSMNNLNAYPVFPWILTDYSSDQLDLENEDVYRDLSKPVGALNLQRLTKLRQLASAVPDMNYLYYSTYSSIFMVLHLMVRLEPFTTVHIKLQDDKFDVASRMFTSVADCFQRCCDNNANFRELVPEFFFCPDFLLNNDNFDLGVLPDGTQVNHVNLPPWAASPEEFIHIHKKALESDYVSLHINEWIDLIWGCKQTGEEAVKADNTFDPRLYPDCWSKVSDQLEIPVVEDMLMKVGIIPQKIFDSPHPSRLPRPKESKSGFTEIKVANSAIIDTKINGESVEKFTIFSLHRDGRIFISRNNNSISQVSKDRIGKISVHSSSLNDSVFFAFTSENSSDLIVVKSNGSITIKMSSLHIDAISCACFYRNEVITGGKDSILVKWAFNDKQDLVNTRSLMAHADIVSCVCASDSFGVVVSCSIDGLLVASLACDFSFLMAVEMKVDQPFVPTHVVITEMTGRIVVLCENPRNKDDKYQLFVYSLNGKLLLKQTYERSITAWCLATRSDGFDFLIVSDNNNIVYLYDAFDMKLVRVVFHASSKVSHIHYHRGIDLLTIGTDAGTLYVGALFQ